jgi:hypothetical protein
MATVAQNITALYGDQTAAREAQAQATQHRPTAAAARPACPEAAFSLTLKGFLDGQEAMLTVRGQTPEEFTANLQVVRGLFDAPAAQPAMPPASHAASQHAAPPTPEGSMICPVHQVLMTKQSNARGSWLSHPKPDGGWCKGK